MKILFYKIKKIKNKFLIKQKFKNIQHQFIIVLDIDGVFTDGKFIYSQEGKILKMFGSWDSDALSSVQGKVELRFISADPSGFAISKKRVEDMGYHLSFIHALDRENLILELKQEFVVVYMADSYSDCAALAAADISATPANAHKRAKKISSFNLDSSGGEGAVAELIELLQEIKLF